MKNNEDKNFFKNLDKNVIFNSSLERKKIGHQIIIDWENNNKHNLNILKNLIDTIFQRIENLLSISLKRFNSINDLFKNLKIKMNIINVKPVLKIFNIDNENNNLSLNNCLLKFNTGLDNFNKNFADFNKEINNEIIENILKKEVSQYEKIIKILYSKIEPYKKKVQKNSENLIISMNNLSKIHKENITKNPYKDILINCLDFYFLSKEIMNNIISLSNILIEIWENSIILEENRNELIKKSFFHFFVLINQTFGNASENLFLESKNEFFKLNSKEWADSFFNIKKILIEEEIFLVSKKLNKKEDLNFNDLKDYFKSFNILFNQLSLNYLILSKWDCLLNNKENVTLYLSVDFIFSSFFISLFKRKWRNNQKSRNF